MTSKLYESYTLEDGTSVNVKKETANGFTVYSYYVKGVFTFGLLKPISKEAIQNLYNDGYFKSFAGGGKNEN